MKLLICDDDPPTIDVIEQHFDWRSLGIKQILRAYHGLAAKEILAKQHPELTLCDIGMPQCDGIEVLHYVSENKIPTCFAFLTCYESFEYAREAMRYGAVNYITKPLDLAELHDTLSKMVDTVRMRQKATGTPQSEESKINTFLRSLSDGRWACDAELIQQVLVHRGLSLSSMEQWRCVCVGAELSGAKNMGWETSLIHYGLQMLAQESITDRIGLAYTVAELGEQSGTILLFIEASRFTEKELFYRCQSMNQTCWKYMSIRPVCVISNTFPLFQAADVIPALKKRCRKLRFHPGRTFCASEAQQFLEKAPATLNASEMMSCIAQRKRSDFLGIVSRFLDQVDKSHCDADVQIKLLHHALLQTVCRCLADNGITTQALFQSEQMCELDANAERSMFDCLKFASALYDHAAELLDTSGGDYETIQSVIHYVRQHYKEDLSREQLAQIAHITPNYLSRRFRAETGMYLREFINKLRIQEATRLLLTTSMNATEIANETGFGNISYFSTVFHKATGMSPVDYRHNGDTP